MAEISEKQLKVLEKLISDEAFRKGFFEDPDAAVAKAGLDLNEEEMAGLKKFDSGTFSSALTDLDQRLSKSAASVFGDVASDVTSDVASTAMGLLQSLLSSQTS
jgi:hypothetical protein